MLQVVGKSHFEKSVELKIFLLLWKG